MQLRYEELQIDQIIQTVAQLISQRFVENRPALICDVQSPLPPVRGNRQCLITILSNLLDSSFPYSPPGSHVEIVARCVDRRIHVDIADRAGWAAHGRRCLASSGLRLAIAKELIELHGGRIWLEKRASGQHLQLHTADRGYRIVSSAKTPAHVSLL